MASFSNYGYENYQNNPLMCKTSPPLSAIQRFLLDNNKRHFSVKTTRNEEHVAGEGSINECHSNFAFHSCGNGDFSTGFFDNESGPYWMQEMYTNLRLNQNNELSSHENIKYLGNKSKGSSFIKGQWTDGEDRALINLVIKHGEKRWAKIAEHMHGRVGKQCRERWHNHLRPDIKKDIWSEEEERMLIEAHIQVGNKWADIAKRISGRTENSIKNHWNATKRRQSSKRKRKKIQEEGKGKSMLLQEYQIKIFGAKKSDSTTSTITEDITLSESSNDDHTPQLFDCTTDDELKFMMNLFSKKNDQLSNDNNDKQAMKDQSVGAFKYEGKLVTSDSFMNVSVLAEELPTQTYLSSDRYISYLLDRPTNNFPNCMHGHHGNGDIDLMEFAASHEMFSHGDNTDSRP